MFTACQHCVNPAECAAERECYLWRCEHPHAPAPERDEVAEFAELLLRVNAARMT